MLHTALRMVLLTTRPCLWRFIRRNRSWGGNLPTSRFGHVESIRVQSNNGLTRIWVPNFGRYFLNPYQEATPLHSRRWTTTWSSWAIQRTGKDLVVYANVGRVIGHFLGWTGKFYSVFVDP